MRILIADDDPIIRLDLRQILENLQYEVIGEAGDGQEAFDRAKELKPDVCILDVKMPQVDGIETATRLAEEGVAPAVLLTAYSDPELIQRATAAGVFGYLVKPFKPSDLPPAIEVARARFDQTLALAKEAATATERLETRKLLDRAKGILMDSYKVNEAEAYRRIQTASMESRKSMKEVAEAILLAHQTANGE